MSKTNPDQKGRVLTKEEVAAVMKRPAIKIIKDTALAFPWIGPIKNDEEKP